VSTETIIFSSAESSGEEVTRIHEVKNSIQEENQNSVSFNLPYGISFEERACNLEKTKAMYSQIL
jgi:hypothetical protein